MVDLLLKALCISLFGYSIGFIVLELKSKFDGSFLYFGMTMVLFSLFCGIDLWMQPQATNLEWTNLQHFLFCFIPPLFIKYLSLLAKKSENSFLKIQFIVSGCISILFALNLMFDVTDSVTVPNILYLTIFLPYLIFILLFLNYYVIRSYLQSTGFDKKIYLLHILGLLIITICGLLDIIAILNTNFLVEVSSFTILGAIGLGILLSYLFTERIILLIRDKDKSLEELTLAYSELEHARSLGELGQSSAMISHEIKNYVHKTLGYMQLVETIKEIPDEDRRWVEKSISSIKGLNEFSNDILDFSKSKILKEKKPLNICERITNTISEHFPDRSNDIELSYSAKAIIVHGDWQKLDHVFMNLFQNSFEAGANRIKVKILHTQSVSLVTIEDDGCGIDSEKVKDIFTAFFSTKLRNGGSGLGMSIVRSIIEGHGGFISAQSKNRPEGAETGIIFNISFPAFEESMQESTYKNDDIILIKDGLHPLPAIEKTFQNILVKPRLLQDLQGFIKQKNENNNTIILGSPEIIGTINKLAKKYTCYSIVDNSEKGLYVAGNNSDLYQGKFNEEFILNHLQNS